jgi:hypothetical protein
VAAAGRHPGPCGASGQTARRSDLAGWAGYGWDRSHSRWYWGLKLYVLACPDGLPTAWCLATPTLGEREVAEALLDRAARQHILRPGLVVVADKGLAGRAFEQTVAELGAQLVRPDRADESTRFGNLGGFASGSRPSSTPLNDQLRLEAHGAHTIQGLWVRVAQQLLALAAGVRFNWQRNAPVKRSLVAYDHQPHPPIDISDLAGRAMRGPPPIPRAEVLARWSRASSAPHVIPMASRRRQASLRWPAGACLTQEAGSSGGRRRPALAVSLAGVLGRSGGGR